MLNVKKLFLLSGVTCLSMSAAAAAEHPKNELWYRQPADCWEAALPVGNGLIGAMIYGTVETEHLQFNHSTYWSGGPFSNDNPGAGKSLQKVRQLIFAGKYNEAHKLVNEKMMGKPKSSMSYLPVGDLYLKFPGHEKFTDYRRSLDLADATCKTSYRVDGVLFKRKTFISAVDGVMVIRLTADKPNAINFTARFGSVQKKTKVSVNDQGLLVLSGKAPGKHRIPGTTKFQAALKIHADNGKIVLGKKSIKVIKANSVTLVMALETSFVNFRDTSANVSNKISRRMQKMATRKYDQVLAAHLANCNEIFNRTSIFLGTSDVAKLPTDVRLKKFSAGGEDPALAALYFQFGRYLLMSSSRAGGPPPNLQGIWNDRPKPPWKSNYTIDMNLEMNYWLAETLNLSELHEPLFDYLENLAKAGANTAKIHWNAKKGWVAHHNTDIWCSTAPQDGATWGIWPTGGAWLTTDVWMHYSFTNDKKFLQRMYPVLKGCAEFYVETLVKHPKKGWLVTCPSISPENRHLPGNVSLCAGPSMDAQIIRDIFTQCADAADVLNKDKELAEKLPPHQIGKGGYLQEWIDDWDMKVPSKRHRHISHLYAVYPGAQITTQTPRLLKAAMKSLDIRGNGSTSWSKAWYMNCRARFHQAERAYDIFADLLRVQTYPNMFDAHKKQGKGKKKPLSWQLFQIDANFGAPAGIAEMLLQSHLRNEKGYYVLELLPALPNAWATGEVKGLRARGGFEVAMKWRNAKLMTVTIKSTFGKNLVIRYRNAETNKTITPGTTITFDAELKPLK